MRGHQGSRRASATALRGRTRVGLRLVSGSPGVPQGKVEDGVGFSNRCGRRCSGNRRHGGAGASPSSSGRLRRSSARPPSPPGACVSLFRVLDDSGVLRQTRALISKALARHHAWHRHLTRYLHSGTYGSAKRVHRQLGKGRWDDVLQATISHTEEVPWQIVAQDRGRCTRSRGL